MSPTKQPPLELLLRESQELHLAAESLRSAIATDQFTKQEVAEMVRKLADAVENHFSLEEKGGYLSGVVQRMPHMEDRVSHLHQQHAELLEAVQKMSILATSGMESPTWWKQISGDASKFVNDLIKHEHAENELVQQAFTEDIGTKD